VNYRIEGEYIESDPGEAVEYFDRLTYTEFLRTEGVGVNLKMGMIYKPMQALRLGLAFHTPTALRLTDTYNNSFTYDYTDGNGSYSGATQTSPDGVTDYRLRTPWRASASAAVVVKKFGFLSADVEVVDYSANRFNMTADVSSQENELFERALNSDLQRDYKQTMNVRLGGEAALDKFRLRAGLNLLGKPQEGESGFNTAYTAGLGVRGESFYFDLGYRRSTGDGSVRPYADAPVASTSRVSNDVVVTLGFKF
jgi:long-subunit fatty acid transport protein